MKTPSRKVKLVAGVETYGLKPQVALRLYLSVFRGVARAAILTAAGAPAQDWSRPFTFVPVSAPEMVLEAVPPGAVEGNAVSTGRRTGGENQVRVVMPKEGNSYALQAKASPRLVLAVAAGKTNNGTPVVPETDSGKPWQRWIVKASADGSLSLLAAHAPSNGLADFGGGITPRSRQDLRDYNTGDVQPAGSKPDQRVDQLPAGRTSIPLIFAFRSGLVDGEEIRMTMLP
jgi:hypothetical protein